MKKIISELGTIKHYRKDVLHRDDNLPAVIFFNGDKEWWENGRLYKRVLSNGITSYYKNNLLHNIKGPALSFPNGKSYFFKNGKEIKSTTIVT